MKKEYVPRLFDDILDFSLQCKGAVLVVGPKWCGKTTTCKRHAKTVIDLLPMKTRYQLVELAKYSDIFSNLWWQIVYIKLTFLFIILEKIVA